MQPAYICYTNDMHEGIGTHYDSKPYKIILMCNLHGLELLQFTILALTSLALFFFLMKVDMSVELDA